MKLNQDYYENIKIIKEKLNFTKNFDINLKEYTVKGKKISFIYLAGLSSGTNTIEVINSILKIETNKINVDSLINVINTQQTEKTDDLENLIDKILSGVIGIVLEESDNAILLDLRFFPGRQPQEPDNEKVVRGSRDGFVENIALNVSLVRRRIKSGRLINELYKVGSESKTDIVLSYMEGIADESLLNNIRSKIEEIKTKELTMTDKALEELMIKKAFNPYPMVRYTERPDTVAVHLYQGQIAIFVDNSPSVMLAPTTFFEHLQHVEEYRQTPVIGTFLRFIRLFGIFLSLFLIPVWLAFVTKPEIVPSYLKFLLPKETGGIPLLMQILIAEIGIEFLRLAAIHTPNSISSAMGVIAGLLVGEVAINVGLFIPDVVLYVAVSQIGCYVTPSYELSLANKLSKIFFIVCTYFFFVWGLIASVLLWFIYLCSLKSFGKRYMYPLVPFNFKKLLKSFVRFPKK